MKLVKIIRVGALAITTGTPAFAANPPLDRPTPPPCCADGICYPKPDTWGNYQTRWRRWPAEELEPTPAAGAKQPGKELPGVPSYETIPPDLEDRRAPPPTKPRLEAEERPEAPSERPMTPPSGVEPTAPRSGPLSSPPGGLLQSPPESPLTPAPSTPFSPGPGTSPLLPPPSNNKMPWENGNEPTGDWDPPPAPPSATAVSIDRSRPPATPNRFVPAQPVRPTVPTRQTPNGDPPPALPVALASATY
jgi:hypothetical protein